MSQPQVPEPSPLAPTWEYKTRFLSKLVRLHKTRTKFPNSKLKLFISREVDADGLGLGTWKLPSAKPYKTKSKFIDRCWFLQHTCEQHFFNIPDFRLLIDWLIRLLNTVHHLPVRCIPLPGQTPPYCQTRREVVFPSCNTRVPLTGSCSIRKGTETSGMLKLYTLIYIVRSSSRQQWVDESRDGGDIKVAPAPRPVWISVALRMHDQSL